MKYWFQAAEGKLDPFVLVLEGSVPNESIKKEGYWAAMGTDPDTGQPITTNEWLDRLSPKALAVIACGTCATYGGIHAMQGNPTGAMGLPDYLGWGWRSKAGLPIINVPGCPVQPDNMMETVLYLLYQAAGLAPMIPLDDQLRPTWLFGKTVHEGCDRAGYYEQADFAHEYGSPKCIVKLGCWGPVVNCNVPNVAGWMASEVARTSAASASGAPCQVSRTSSCHSWMPRPVLRCLPTSPVSGEASVRLLRGITNRSVNKEPTWRHRRREITTGYTPTHYGTNR